MPWWGWVTIGALLLVAEMTIVDLEFYLIFLGIAALQSRVASSRLEGPELALLGAVALLRCISHRLTRHISTHALPEAAATAGRRGRRGSHRRAR